MAGVEYGITCDKETKTRPLSDLLHCCYNIDKSWDISTSWVGRGLLVESEKKLPTMPATVAPLVYAVPAQLIAYHTAVIMGTGVDQPRNLAKSVTVE
jgi:hypothetical protein